MLKREIKFTDYDGKTRIFEAYFHMTKAEVILWLTTSGDYTLDKVLERLVKESNGRRIMETFEDLIHRSYGVKSLDGVQFVKNEEEWQKFHQSEAYSELFCELVTDAKAAAAFVNGIVPKDLAREIEKVMKENPEGIPDSLKEYVVEEKPATAAIATVGGVSAPIEENADSAANNVVSMPAT